MAGRLWAAALVAGLALPATAGAGNWADVKDWPDMAESKGICRQFIHVAPPATDRPDAKALAALAECNSEELYYGIGRPPDPAAARACAFAEASRGEGDRPLGGDAMLMTVYANGTGATRRLDVAIALACTLDGAPAEMDGRVKHLHGLMQQAWTGHDFSWCDDITSGAAEGFCADHDARVEDAKRSARLAKVAGRWANGPAAEPFHALREAVDSFIDSRGGNEVSPQGTAHAALVIEQEETQRQLFVEDLEGFAGGKPPCAGAERSADADSRLNAVYGKIQKLPADQFAEATGDVEQSGIKQTQRAWLKYRDAWAAFVAAAYPDVPRAAVLNWLTLRRVKQLEEFLTE